MFRGDTLVKTPACLFVFVAKIIIETPIRQTMSGAHFSWAKLYIIGLQMDWGMERLKLTLNSIV